MYSQKYSTLKIWSKMANLCTGGRNRANGEFSNRRASEASEILSGLFNRESRYMYIL